MGTSQVGQQTSANESQTKDSAKDFHLKEFETLRHEQDALDGRLVTIIQYLLLFSGVIYSFLLVHTPTAIIERIAYASAWFVPLVASIVGKLVLHAQVFDIQRISRYLYVVENQYGFSTVLGWEHFKHKPENEGFTLKLIPRIWRLIIGFNIVAGVIGIFLNILR